MKIAVDCGHNPPEDYGCTNLHHNLAEFVECHKIISHVYDSLWREHIRIVNFAERLKTKVWIVNKAKPVCAVELHLNSSSNPKARGSLCMYYPTKKSEQLAKFILDNIGKIINQPKLGISLPTRGAYVGNYQLDPSKAILYFLRRTKCPAVVVEPLFLSNDQDVYLLKKLKYHRYIATGIFLGILDYLRIYK